jgi:hypothetical protein
VADQFVTLTCAAPRLRVRAIMDTEAPVITGGYGGFEEVSRPGRRALVAWSGAAAYRMSVALVLDGWRARSSVEDDCVALERMASMVRAFQAPPKVRVSGAAVPKAGLEWRIDELTWGDVLRSRAGARLRQRVTLGLVQAVDEGRGVRVSAASNRRSSGRTVHLAPPGGAVALQRLAGRELGASKRWKEIALLNGIRTPARAKAGMLLRLP